MYEHPVDMRKSFDGLHAIASQATQEDALSGVLFLSSRSIASDARFEDGDDGREGATLQ